MGTELSDWVEDIVEKGQIALYEQFLLFPQCFQKLPVVDASKWVSMEERVKPHFARARLIFFTSVTGDHSFKHDCFPFSIQYLHVTAALGRILLSSVVMVLVFGARGHWFKSCPDLIFLPCIYSFVSLLRTLFIRRGLIQDRPLSHQSHLSSKKWTFCPIGFPSIKWWL